MSASRLKVVLACNFTRDERIGTSRVPLRIADELRRREVDVSLIFAEDLVRVGQPHVDLLTAPLRMARALLAGARDAHVVDIAGFDAWLYATLARRLRPGQAIISRSNGLWYRALAANGQIEKTPMRRVLSDAFQKQLLCRWERASMQRADIALFGAHDDARAVVANGWKSEEGVAVVAPGVDAFFASAVPLEERRGIAFVGGFLHRKGNDIVGAAMSKVLLERPAAELTLFGTGVPAPAVLAQFETAVRSRVHVAPPLSSVELAARLGRFAILVFPTRYEGFGLVVLEAMRAGLAVVTTPTGAGADMVRHDENGLITPFEDVEATRAAVCRLLDAPDLRIRLGRAAAEEAVRRSWERTALELTEVYGRARRMADRRRVSP